MSILEIRDAIINLQINDELVQSPGFCRYAVKKMRAVAIEANKTPPVAEVKVVFWKPCGRLRSKEEVHFALEVDAGNERYIFNTSQAAQFPKYCGSFDRAPGLLSKMRYYSKK